MKLAFLSRRHARGMWRLIINTFLAIVGVVFRRNCNQFNWCRPCVWTSNLWPSVLVKHTYCDSQQVNLKQSSRYSFYRQWLSPLFLINANPDVKCPRIYQFLSLHHALWGIYQWKGYLSWLIYPAWQRAFDPETINDSKPPEGLKNKMPALQGHFHA